MNRRRLIWQKAQEQSTLPEGYTAVDYLQSSGTQYIDTGRKLTQNSDITIDFMIVGEKNRNAGIFGSRESASKNNLTLFQQTSPNAFNVDFSEYQKHRFTTDLSLSRIKIRMNKFGVWVNDILQTSWNDVANFETPTNGLIFDVGNNNWTGNKAIMRLYGYADGNAQKLVPCLDANGVPCMFDLVSQKPFYDAGTGSFTWG